MATIPVLRAREKPQSWADIASGLVQGFGSTYIPRMQKAYEQKQQQQQLQQLMNSQIANEEDPIKFAASTQGLDPNLQRSLLKAYELNQKRKQFESLSKFFPTGEDTTGTKAENPLDALNEVDTGTADGYETQESPLTRQVGRIVSQYQEPLEANFEALPEEQLVGTNRFQQQPSLITKKIDPWAPKGPFKPNDVTTWSKNQLAQAIPARKSKDPAIAFVGERAYQQFKERESEEQRLAKQTTDERKELREERRDFRKANEQVFKRLDEYESESPVMRANLNAMKQSVGDNTFFSRANLTNMFGLKGIQSPGGAAFASAAKNFLFSDIKPLGGKLNMYIEKRASDALAQTGHNVPTNNSVIALQEFKMNIRDAETRLAREIESEYIRNPNLQYTLGSFKKVLSERMQPLIQHQQDVLSYKLRKYQEEDAGPAIYNIKRKVDPGTPLTPKMGKQLLLRNNNDWKAAMDEAIKMGFSIPSDEVVDEVEGKR